jgi:hypothetical protein
VAPIAVLVPNVDDVRPLPLIADGVSELWLENPRPASAKTAKRVPSAF